MTRTTRGAWKFALLFCIVLSISSPLMAQQHGQYQPGQYGFERRHHARSWIHLRGLQPQLRCRPAESRKRHSVQRHGHVQHLGRGELLLLCSQVQDSRNEVRAVCRFPHDSHRLARAPVPGEWQDSWIRGLRSCGYVVSTGKSSMARSAGRFLGGICLRGAHRPLHAGATTNVGSGYWGNDFTSGSTFYITKDQGTTFNIMGNWEIHGSKTTRSGDISTMFGTLPINVKLTPGAAWSDEWGLGQAIPLNKPFLKTKNITKVAQLGIIGYDEAQLSRNRSDNTIVDAFERLVPFVLHARRRWAGQLYRSKE